MMGGGGNTFGDSDVPTATNMTFNDFNFAAAAILDDGMTAVNMNGTYKLSNHSTKSVTMQAWPSSHEDYNGTETTATTEGDYMEATVTKGGIEWKTGGTTTSD